MARPFLSTQFWQTISGRRRIVETVESGGFFGVPGLSDEQKNAYIAALKKMYDTPQWSTVRDRNGCVDIFNADADFVKFLEGQEAQIGGLMKELGFL
ncbi:MAG: hypothetical protein AAGI12_07485 [Pseudomonadota bacterium]